DEERSRLSVGFESESKVRGGVNDAMFGKSKEKTIELETSLPVNHNSYEPIVFKSFDITLQKIKIDSWQFLNYTIQLFSFDIERKSTEWFNLQKPKDHFIIILISRYINEFAISP
ncbi:unnamed protein product, partial [Rotaria socialis]